MSNVIHVEFGRKTNDVGLEVFGVGPDLAAYLEWLRESGVDEEDILETIDAINNVDTYLAADDVVREFADGWLEKFL